jgi:hypothetical protein
MICADMRRYLMTFLAMEAMCIQPSLTFEETPNGNFVFGSVDQIEVSKGEFDDFSQDLQKFEE